MEKVKITISSHNIVEHPNRKLKDKWICKPQNFMVHYDNS